ncbi:MAG: Dockerin type domain, partial [Planctomycetota bacterium]
TLFNGWFAEVGGDHADLVINACLWLNPPAPPACPADFDQNGNVDGADLTLLLQSWGPCSNCAADINQNGAVDGADLTVLLQSWGGCV